MYSMSNLLLELLQVKKVCKVAEGALLVSTKSTVDFTKFWLILSCLSLKYIRFEPMFELAIPQGLPCKFNAKFSSSFK